MDSLTGWRRSFAEMLVLCPVCRFRHHSTESAMTSFTKFRNLMLSSVRASWRCRSPHRPRPAPVLSGAMTLGLQLVLDRIRSGGPTLITTPLSIDVISDIAFSEAFSVGLDFSMTSGTLDAGGGLEIDLDLIGLAIEPEYHFRQRRLRRRLLPDGRPRPVAAVPARSPSASIPKATVSSVATSTGPLWVEAFRRQIRHRSGPAGRHRHRGLTVSPRPTRSTASSACSAVSCAPTSTGSGPVSTFTSVAIGGRL